MADGHRKRISLRCLALVTAIIQSRSALGAPSNHIAVLFERNPHQLAACAHARFCKQLL